MACAHHCRSNTAHDGIARMQNQELLWLYKAPFTQREQLYWYLAELVKMLPGLAWPKQHTPCKQLIPSVLSLHAGLVQRNTVSVTCDPATPHIWQQARRTKTSWPILSQHRICQKVCAVRRWVTAHPEPCISAKLAFSSHSQHPHAFADNSMGHSGCLSGSKGHSCTVALGCVP